MIEKIDMYTAVCDHCQFAYGMDGEYSAWGEKSTMEEVLTDDGWYTDSPEIPMDPDKHYCPDCWYIDDNDVIVLKVDRLNKHAIEVT